MSEKKLLRWYNPKEKRFKTIPPSVFVEFFRQALKRWKYDIPMNFSLVSVKQALDMIYSKRDNSFQNLLDDSKGQVGQSKGGNNSKLLETDCPRCGEILITELDVNDLESLVSGIRVLHKAVKHGRGMNSHVVDLYIDSNCNIRRKHTTKLAKALH